LGRGIRRKVGEGVVALALILLLALPVRAQDWQADWQRTIAAAKKEGQLVISGPSGSAWREQLLAFEKEYPEIKLAITPVASRDFWPRVIKEREAGQKLWDFRIGGPDHVAYQLKRTGNMAPVRPLLILPEVTDPKSWYGGIDGTFLDSEKRYFFGFAIYEENVAYYNGKLIPEVELPDMRSLADPRWTGKISMADPRAGSPLTGSGALLRIYGEAYLRQVMGERKPVIVKEPRQQVDWLASGRYPISIGLPSITFVEYAARGANVDGFRKIPGPHVWTQGVGGVQMPEGSPHPNATKLYINWLASRAVQARMMPIVKLNSRRTDVAIADPPNAVDYAALDTYVGGQTEAQQEYQAKAAAVLRELLQ